MATALVTNLNVAGLLITRLRRLNPVGAAYPDTFHLLRLLTCIGGNASVVFVVYARRSTVPCSHSIGIEFVFCIIQSGNCIGMAPERGLATTLDITRGNGMARRFAVNLNTYRTDTMRAFFRKRRSRSDVWHSRGIHSS